ncbi:acyltransferase [Halochromatium roseum]|uniref:acyltransferase n=1 Tax=Halochromatium roseum TaxID=391920 RepID=UPI001912B7B0|nr:acyltransferase [Halochromatium roseum]
MRTRLKNLLNVSSQVLMLPLTLLCKIEEKLISKDVEVIFNICTHVVALLPGLPGVFLRRGFYSIALEQCSLDSYIGFGTIFSHRATMVADHVYIGSYALIGSAILGQHCLIGSRASILSGTALHILDDDGTWTPYSPERLERITIEPNVWIGEGAIVAANIGRGSMIGAGCVITTPVKAQVIMAGNPARFVRKLEPEAQPETLT